MVETMAAVAAFGFVFVTVTLIGYEWIRRGA